MVHDITEATFEEEVLQSDIPVLIDFWADWCVPCRRMGPIFEEVAGQYEGRVKFARIDTKVEKGLRIKFAIASLPTVTLVRDGVVIDIVDQAVPATELARRLDIALTGSLDAEHSRKLIG